MPLSARMTACEPTSRSLRRRRCAGLYRKERQTKKTEKAGHDRGDGRIRIITAQAK